MGGDTRGRPALRISAVPGAVLAVALLAGAGWSFNAGLGDAARAEPPGRAARRDPAGGAEPGFDGFASLMDGMLTADNGDAARGAQLLNLALRRREIRLGIQRG
jgi:hypothetical protein